MIFRLYHETKGGHVHIRFFAGPKEGMRVEEFNEFIFVTKGIEFVPEWLGDPR